MLFTIIGFLGSILILSYYMCKIPEKETITIQPELVHEEEFEKELEKELNTIVDDEREKLLNTIRRRLKPKDEPSSKEQDSCQT